jgi:tRNA (guanine-N7-)-methyltransferase
VAPTSPAPRETEPADRAAARLDARALGADRGHPFWSELFGNTGPVEIEIGCSDGSFLLAAAARAPRTNFLGIEWSPRKASRLAERIRRAYGSRVHILRADASCVVRHLLPERSVAAYHVYFPDPWPKRRHAERRLFSPAFIDAVTRTLVEGGRISVATDVESYMRAIERTFAASPAFAPAPTEADDPPGLRTTFARKYRAAGRSLYAASFVRVPISADRPPRR